MNRSPAFGTMAVLLAFAAVAAPWAGADSSTPSPSADVSSSQDPATYPPGVTRVAHTPIHPGADFEVAAATDDPELTAATVTLCRFGSLDAEAPEVCYMNLEASLDGGVFRANTDAAPHPAWEGGWILGYKLTFMGEGDDERHAPTSGGYYLAVVEGAPAGGSQHAPLGPIAFAALGTAAFLRRR
ncbi:MAG TPA: hypothetical protein VI796_04595 [Candidatus Thermoplasmatota archaeon]|nr:hypothetical protein [Candidatus Thermoplasmatota archaeon]